MGTLIFLQNAYGVEPGYEPDYSKDSFRNCHTGKRLLEMLPPGESVIIRNASPVVGTAASDCFDPDPEYMANQILSEEPNRILVCGEQAKDGFFKMLDTHRLPPYVKRVVFAPHPAYRALSKKKTSAIRAKMLRPL